MAYLRYHCRCDWYIFGLISDAARPEDERVAVWHAGHRAEAPEFSYPQVRDMLARGDFSAIPGFGPEHEEQIRGALAAFVGDVDEEYGRGL